MLSWIVSPLWCITESHSKKKTLAKERRGKKKNPSVCWQQGKCPKNHALVQPQHRSVSSLELWQHSASTFIWTLNQLCLWVCFNTHNKSSCRASNNGPKPPHPPDTTHWSNTNLLPLQICSTNYQVNQLPPSFLHDQVISLPKKLVWT